MPRGIYERTTEHNANISKALKGKKYAPGRVHPRGMLGKKMTAEHKAKIAKALKGRITCKFTTETRAKMSQAKKGKSPWNKGKLNPNQSGEKHWAWKGGITSQTRKDRIKFAVTISPQVFTRDNYICSVCLVRGGYLHADHIKSWKDYPELRFDIDNCRTLCRTCHYYVTFKRKIPNNSKWGMFKDYTELANGIFK